MSQTMIAVREGSHDSFEVVAAPVRDLDWSWKVRGVSAAMAERAAPQTSAKRDGRKQRVRFMAFPIEAGKTRTVRSTFASFRPRERLAKLPGLRLHLILAAEPLVDLAVVATFVATEAGDR
jgi:hypothetical protein